MPRRTFISLVLGVSGNVNADAGVGIRIPMKKIVTWNREIRAFVSPRCIRRAIRTRLAEKGMKVDPLILLKEQQKKQLADTGDPFKYVDDDLFGYLSPEKGKGEIQPSRSSPVKISPLIALHHTEISVEFAGRFPRSDISADAPESNPVPFEVETAQWLGGMHVIISEDIGRFRVDELSKKVLDGLEKGEYAGVVKKDGVVMLDLNERKKRLKALLEILIKEGWCFPRGSEATSQPEYHYAIIVMSESFIPMPNVLKMDQKLKLDVNSVKEALKIYNWEKAYIIDYENREIHIFNGKNVKREGSAERAEIEAEKVDMTEGSLNDVIEALTNFMLRS